MNARPKWWLITVAALAGVVITASLGRWQLVRASQKESLQATIDSKSQQQVLDASTLRQAADPDVFVHQHAALRGIWLAQCTVYLENRQMNARVGFFTMTPLALDGGGVIVVQRGWVPRNFEDRGVVPRVETPTGSVMVEGRIAPPPSKLYEPGSPTGSAIRQNLDLAQYQVETGLALMPVTLLQTGAPSEGLLREWPAVNLGVEKHYGYAAQWFALSVLIAALYFWFQVVRRFMIRPKDPAHNV